MKSNPPVTGTEQPSLFSEQVEILFHEAEMAVKWQRPAVLFAVYRSEAVRVMAETSLEEKLNQIGQAVLTIHAQEVENFDLVAHISKTDDLLNTFFSIDGLAWDCNAEGTNFISEINRQREFLIDESVRAIFWLKENEVSDFATNATECWILRHRVVDFTNTPKAEEILLSAIESVWENENMGVLSDIPIPSSPREVLDLASGQELDIQYANNLLTLGVLCWRRGDSQTGLKLLKAAREIADLHHDTAIMAKSENAIALLLASLGDVDNAIASYIKAKELMPNAKINWNVFGSLLSKRENYEDAIQAFKKALATNPNDFSSWFGLGQVFLKLEQYENAISAFKKSLEFAPAYKYAILGLGQCYLETGQIDQAVLACKNVLALDLGMPEAWHILCKCHMKEHKIDQAISDCENAIELDGTNALTWNELGNAYLLNKEYEKSVLSYQKAIELQPELGWAYTSMAFAYEKLGNYVEAKAFYQQSVPLFEKNADRAAIWHQLGGVYVNLNDNEKAEACYKQSSWLLDQDTEESPQLPAALINKTSTAVSNPVSDLPPKPGVGEGDVPMNESNRKVDILTAQDWNELGNSHLKVGAYNEAIKAYARAIELAKDMNWPYIKNLAMANYRLGKVNGGKNGNVVTDPDVWDEDDESGHDKEYFVGVDIPLAQRGDPELGMQSGNENPRSEDPGTALASTEPENGILVSSMSDTAFIGWNGSDNSYF